MKMSSMCRVSRLLGCVRMVEGVFFLDCDVEIVFCYNAGAIAGIFNSSVIAQQLQQVATALDAKDLKLRGPSLKSLLCWIQGALCRSSSKVFLGWVVQSVRELNSNTRYCSICAIDMF